MANNIYVIKLGTSILKKNKGSGLDLKRIKDILRQVARLKKNSNKVVLVSSGAIALGMQLLKMKKRPRRLEELQAAASVGQGMIIKIFNDCLKSSKLLAAQVLLTYGDFNDRMRYLNAKNTIVHLLAHDVIPVINENDAISTEEIKVGDNDKLSALVANMIEADLLLMLSNVEGLYDENGNLIEVVSNIDTNVCKLAKGTTEEDTSVGGMGTKLEAACISCEAGIPCVIANGKSKNIISQVVFSKFKGTTFIPSEKKLVAKKRWLAYGSKPKGRVIIDDGAMDAVLKNKSLLAVGIISVEGKFDCGDVVAVINKNKEIARGLVKCGSQEVEKAKGQRHKHEIIHKNNLVVVKRIN